MLKKKKLILLQKKTKIVLNVLNALWDEKVILGYRFLNNDFVKIYLKFDNLGKSLIKKIIIISKPGNKKYINIFDLKSNHNTQINYFCFLSTSKGILSHSKALLKGIGGEILFKIYI